MVALRPRGSKARFVNQRRSNIDNRFQTMAVPANHSDKNVPADVRVVEISREPVELYKILKFEGMVARGDQAKVVVAAGQVLVNGHFEGSKFWKDGGPIPKKLAKLYWRLSWGIFAGIFGFYIR